MLSPALKLWAPSPSSPSTGKEKLFFKTHFENKFLGGKRSAPRARSHMNSLPHTPAAAAASGSTHSLLRLLGLAPTALAASAASLEATGECAAAAARGTTRPAGSPSPPPRPRPGRTGENLMS